MKFTAQEHSLLEHRMLRDDALALVKDDIAALRGDIEQRGLGARLASRVGGEARELWGQAVEVAEAHRGVIAGTLLALVAWFLRGPISRGVGALLGHEDDRSDDAAETSAAANDRGDST